MSIRVGILGYGNLGKGVESAIAHNADMELVAVFYKAESGEPADSYCRGEGAERGCVKGYEG